MSAEGNRFLAAHNEAVTALDRAVTTGRDYVKLDPLTLHTLLDGLYGVLGMLPAGDGPHRVTTTTPRPYMTIRHPKEPADPGAKRKDGKPYAQPLSPACRERRAAKVRQRVTPAQFNLLERLAKCGDLLEPVPGSGAYRWRLRDPRARPGESLRPVPTRQLKVALRRKWITLRAGVLTGTADLTDAGREAYLTETAERVMAEQRKRELADSRARRQAERAASREGAAA